jgi:hypothetical protein
MSPEDLDLVQSLKTLIIKDFSLLIFLLLIYFVIFYTKYKAGNTKLVSLYFLWREKKTLRKHPVLDKILLARDIKAPFLAIGRRILFSEILGLEIESIYQFLYVYLNKIYDSKNFFSFVKKNWEITQTDIVLGFVNQYETNIKIFYQHCIINLAPDIEVTKSDIIRYLKRNKDILVVTESEQEIIRETIQYQKATLITSKYEEVIYVYRNQIIRNLISQLSIPKPYEILLNNILQNCFMPVITNIHDTIYLRLNKINGEFKNIVYKGFNVEQQNNIDMHL